MAVCIYAETGAALDALLLESFRQFVRKELQIPPESAHGNERLRLQEVHEDVH